MTYAFIDALHVVEKPRLAVAIFSGDALRAGLVCGHLSTAFGSAGLGDRRVLAHGFFVFSSLGLSEE